MFVDTYGTGVKSNAELLDIVNRNFDLRPGCILRDLNLKRPIYEKRLATATLAVMALTSCGNQKKCAKFQLKVDSGEMLQLSTVLALVDVRGGGWYSMTSAFKINKKCRQIAQRHREAFLLRHANFTSRSLQTLEEARKKSIGPKQFVMV